MDHREAIESQAVERYLLKEFSASERDEFEEHYFGCGECASDLRSTSAFLELAGRVTISDGISAPKPKGRTDRKSMETFTLRNCSVDCMLLVHLVPEHISDPEAP